MGTTTLENSLELASKVEDVHILLPYNFNRRNRTQQNLLPMWTRMHYMQKNVCSIIVLNYPKLERPKMVEWINNHSVPIDWNIL